MHATEEIIRHLGTSVAQSAIKDGYVNIVKVRAPAISSSSRFPLVPPPLSLVSALKEVRGSSFLNAIAVVTSA